MSTLFSPAFQQSGCRCVYCCRDLTADFDSFMLAEEDHLIPRGYPGADDPENIVIACRVCNGLKGQFPASESFDANKKRDYIVSARKHIMNKRAEKMEIFAGWVCLPTNMPAKGDPND